MVNENKTVTAGPDGFTVYYLDEKKHFNYPYHQPLLAKLQKLQLFGDSYRGKRYQDFEQDLFSPYQNRLYKDAVYGLGRYSVEELKGMSIQEKLAIKRTNRLAQRVLNLWKQEIVSETVDNFLKSLFPKSKLVQAMTRPGTEHDRDETNHFDFKELGLTKRDIALKLIETNILPPNFFLLRA